MKLNDTIGLAFNTIATALKKNIKKINLEIITITKKDMFKKMSDDEITKLKKGQ